MQGFATRRAVKFAFFPRSVRYLVSRLQQKSDKGLGVNGWGCSVFFSIIAVTASTRPQRAGYLKFESRQCLPPRANVLFVDGRELAAVNVPTTFSLSPRPKFP